MDMRNLGALEQRVGKGHDGGKRRSDNLNKVADSTPAQICGLSFTTWAYDVGLDASRTERKIKKIFTFATNSGRRCCSSMRPMNFCGQETSIRTPSASYDAAAVDAGRGVFDGEALDGG